jgi:hypothetical protein
MGEMRLAIESNKASNSARDSVASGNFRVVLLSEKLGAVLFLTTNINNALKNNFQFKHLQGVFHGTF